MAGPRVLVKHSETGAVREVAASAAPVLAGSGWQELTKTEAAKLEKDRRAERAATEAAMTPGTDTPAPQKTTAGTTPEKES